MACSIRVQNTTELPSKLTRWQARLHTCLYSLALDSEWYPAPEYKDVKKCLIIVKTMTA